jgi:hypothetical protein
MFDGLIRAPWFPTFITNAHIIIWVLLFNKVAEIWKKVVFIVFKWEFKIGPIKSIFIAVFSLWDSKCI